MFSFLKLQLKIYFRQFSTYITPIVISCFYIIITLAINSSTENKLQAEAVLKSSYFSSNLASLSLFISFMTSSFVAQSIFYKYRLEGVEIVMFSKPINRYQIYFANLLACFIGILFMLSITSIGFLISKVMVPNIGLKTIVYSTLSFMLASFLSSLLVLSIGAIVQAVVEMKVYQLIAGVLPFLIILVLNFIKFPAQNKNLNSLAAAQARIVALAPNNKNNSNKQIDELETSIEKSKDILTYNKRMTDIYLNSDKKSLIDVVKNNNKNLYNYLYWLNYDEYYNENFVLYDDNLKKGNEFVNFEPISTEINNNELNLNQFNKYGINLNNNIILRFSVLDSSKNILTTKFFALGFDQYELSNNIKNKGSKTIEDIQSELISGTPIQNIKRLFNNLRKFNNNFLNRLLEISDTYKLDNFYDSSKKIFTTINNHNIFDSSNVEGLIAFIKNVVEDTTIIKPIIDNLFEGKDAFFLPPKKPTTMNPIDQVRYAEALKKYEDVKKELIQGLKYTSAFYLLALEFSNKKININILDLQKINSSTIINGFSSISALSLYDKSIFKIIPLEDNLVVFSRKSPITKIWAISGSLIATFLMFSIGLVIFIRKNFK
ncbi:ABC transporter permease [Mycoplasmopsis lipofaciens]|uniref:ABC transporter permease n=1 Tax=Mycoplasmopsis lipofaciens TaxID=114884 RepID=UPI00047FE378|nr:ABC transporter permease [Mycoplasmopsis lipofaciens]